MTTDLNSLLDMNLDDLADLPAFEIYPAGAHKVRIGWETKSINSHPSLELKMAYLECIELSSPGDKVPDIGTECSVLFMLDNEFGQGKLKAAVSKLRDFFGTSNLFQIVEQSQGLEVTVVTKIRQNKDKTQSYCEISSLTV